MARKLKPDINERRKALAEMRDELRKILLETGDEFIGEELYCVMGEYDALVNNPDNYL